MTREQEAVLLVRSNPIVWMETCSTIMGRDGRLFTPQANSFQRRVAAIYRYCLREKRPCRIIILKPRRKGSSTISLAVGYTHLRNHIGNGAILGDDFGTTAKLMECWDRFAETDKFPAWGNSPSSTMRNFSHGSSVREETANDPRAGMGGDIHFLLASEAAHYRSRGKSSGEYVMQSIMNSVPELPNTVVIMESTPSGAQGVFHASWQSAVEFEDFKRGEVGNGYVRVFAPWFEFGDSVAELRPGEAEMIMSTLDHESQYAGEAELVSLHNVPAEKIQWRRRVIASPACGGDPRKFMQEYPSDPVTCFLTSGNARFDSDGTAKMAAVIDVCEQPKYGTIEMPDGASAPVFVETSRAEAWLRVWERPIEMCRYIGAVDLMTGEQVAASRREADCHAWGIMRSRYTDGDNADHANMLVAAGLPDDRTRDLDIIAERISLASIWYGECPIAPEINNFHGIVQLLRHYGCNVWSRKKAGVGKTVMLPGFQTTSSSKRQIIDELARLIREQEIDIRCARAVSEIRSFITHPDGTEAASSGNHDDWVMCLAILAHILPTAKINESVEARRAREERRNSRAWSRSGIRGPIAEML